MHFLLFFAHLFFFRRGQKTATTEGDAGARFKLVRWGFDVLLLRLGAAVGTAGSLAVETLTGMGFYHASSLAHLVGAQDHENNLTLFHQFEEMEHGALTVQALKKRTSFLLHLLLLPVVMIVVSLFYFTPMITAILANPRERLLVAPKKTLVDFCQYTFVALIGWGTMMWLLVAYWLSPVAVEPYESHHAKYYEYFKKRVEARKISYDIVEKADYSLTC